MNVNGEYRIPATRERIWQALHDPETLRACIPGCEEVRRVSDTEYEGRMSAQVGAVTTIFTGRITLADEDFPGSYDVTARAESPTAGYADGQATVTLVAEADATVLSYRARLETGGRLATVGTRLLNGVAIRLANEFFARLIERLRPVSLGEAPQDLAEPTPAPHAAGAIQPIAPTPAPLVEKPASPVEREEAGTLPHLPHRVDAGTARIVTITGLIIWLLVVAVILWPRA